MVQGFPVGKTACGCPVWLSPVCPGLPRKHACFLLLSTFVCGHVDQGVMKTGILVCGLNGSGKSTLGRALAQALGFTFLDSEDVFFSKADPNTCQKRPASLIARWPFRALTKFFALFSASCPLHSCKHGDFAPAGATRGAFRSPPGPLRFHTCWLFCK